jgi:hypothetical protein
MTADEILEKLLREQEIYPPSVQDSHYYDTPEMTRTEIIEKTLKEMGMLSEQDAQSRDKDRDLSIVITELQRRLLPDGKIKTCGAFRHLNAGCCDPCHTYRPHYSMSMIELPDGSKAWVCCAMKRAIFPERYAKYQEWLRNSPEGKMRREIFGDD